MNWILKIAPKWLTKIDVFLRINYVWIWATRIHLMLYFNLLLTLVVSIISFVAPLDLRDLLKVKDLSNFYIPLLIPAFLFMGFYIFQVVLFNPDKRFTKGKSWHSIVVFLCMQLGLFLPFLMPISTAVVLNYKIANMVSDEEFVEDRNMYLTSGFYLYNGPDYFGFYKNDEDYLKAKNKRYFEPEFKRNGQIYDDYEKKALRDSIFYHKGVFKNQRPKLYRNSNNSIEGLYLLSESLFQPFLQNHIDSIVLNFTIEQNINFSVATALKELGNVNYLLTKYSYYNRLKPDSVIRDFQSNIYKGYVLKNSRVEGIDYYEYNEYEDVYYAHKFNDVGSTLFNLVEAKAYFIPLSMLSFISAMFYVTYFLSVMILLFKWVNWKQFLLFALIIGVLLAILGVFLAIYRFKGKLILNFTLIIMIISYVMLFKSYFTKIYKWWNNQWSIFAYLFLPSIFIFLLGYIGEIFDFWNWHYFKQKYYKRTYNGYGWTWDYIPEYYELKSTVAFICFHSGLLLFVVLLPLLHKVFMRLHAIPKLK